MRRTSQLVGLEFSTGRSISPLPVLSSVSGGTLDFHELSRAPSEAHELAHREYSCAFAKLRLPAWENGRHLLVKDFPVKCVYSDQGIKPNVTFLPISVG